MSFSDVLKHRAVPYRRTESSTWVEGERVPNAEDADGGAEFRCMLFLPAPGSENTTPAYFSPKRIVQPTLLYWPKDVAGAPVALSAEDELGVISPELNVAQGRAEGAEVRWQVQGDPQAFGPPGRPVIGFLATLQRVGE
jgi:hypothetical protein